MDPSAGEGLPNSLLTGDAKAAVRSRIAAVRADRHADRAATAARTRAALAACADAQVVALYLSRPGEPDTAGVIEELYRRGVQVLVPVLSRTPDWARYAGADQLRPGPFGIPQPLGARLGAQSLATAEWIWLPGLAGTASGLRLGTGGGWYDRALLSARAQTPRGLLLHDDEVLESLPVQEWDQRVDLLVTESRVIECPRRNTGHGFPVVTSDR